jgi:hypothetical protein
MTMTTIFVILGIVIVMAAIAVAFDEASLRKKAIGSIVGGLVLGTFFLTPVGMLAGLIAPGSSNPIWKDILLAGFLCGVAGGVIGILGGAMTLALSLLFGYVFSEQIKKKQVL